MERRRQAELEGICTRMYLDALGGIREDEQKELTNPEYNYLLSQLIEKFSRELTRFLREDA